ncbi:protein OBERON 3-like [Camellia sinensis]|uniref:protein OBERON 3-like n=1 Tax=Camellia sinensis TaxID=4442 RepID=UPI0010369849|nr:protein OBERON 3-like [Camellia sinensis]
MQFHCLGCGHASEMFGFVKDVFMSCAKDWGLETLLKELDCVGKIFRGSEDFKGKELHIKADEMLSKLENKLMSPSDVCNFILQFFNYTDGMSDFTSSSVPPKELLANQTNPRNDAAPLRTPKSLPPKSCFYNMNSLQHDLHQSDLNTTPMGDKMIKDEWSVKSSSSKKDGYDSLESIVRIKEVESRMFQNRADEARREAENYRRMVRMKNEKLEEEYAEKLAKLCLQETEERRRKKQEEVKTLENSHFDRGATKTPNKKQNYIDTAYSSGLDYSGSTSSCSYGIGYSNVTLAVAKALSQPPNAIDTTSGYARNAVLLIGREIDEATLKAMAASFKVEASEATSLFFILGCMINGEAKSYDSSMHDRLSV